jgi:hypothetical protein
MVESADEYVHLVVALSMTAGGEWQLSVDDASGARQFPLVPVTVVIRLRRSRGGQLLRGTIALQDGTVSAPIQSNARLEALVRAWLLGEHTANGNP